MKRGRPPVPVDGAMLDLVRRYADGEEAHVLAKERGVAKQTIVRWVSKVALSGKLDKTHDELVTEALVNRVVAADEELEGAKNQLQAMIARDKARFYRMDLERRRPALYGQKQEVNHTGVPPSLSIVLLGAPTGGHVVEGTVVPAAISAPAEDKGEANGQVQGR